MTADYFLEARGSVLVAEAFNAFLTLADIAALFEVADSFFRAAEADLLVITF